MIKTQLKGYETTVWVSSSSSSSSCKHYRRVHLFITTTRRGVKKLKTELQSGLFFTSWITGLLDTFLDTEETLNLQHVLFHLHLHLLSSVFDLYQTSAALAAKCSTIVTSLLLTVSLSLKRGENTAYDKTASKKKKSKRLDFAPSYTLKIFSLLSRGLSKPEKIHIYEALSRELNFYLFFLKVLFVRKVHSKRIK